MFFYNLELINDDNLFIFTENDKKIAINGQYSQGRHLCMR